MQKCWESCSCFSQTHASYTDHIQRSWNNILTTQRRCVESEGGQNKPGFSSEASGTSGNSSEGTSGSSTSPCGTRDQRQLKIRRRTQSRVLSGMIRATDITFVSVLNMSEDSNTLTVMLIGPTWVMASSSASTASSSSCVKEPASISSICCGETMTTA